MRVSFTYGPVQDDLIMLEKRKWSLLKLAKI